MKPEINLLPPEPEKQILKAKQKTVIYYTAIFLVIFLIINLAIFGFYWFLTKSTENTLAAIKTEETNINSLAPREKAYRFLSAKLVFLSSVWKKEAKPVELIDFSQTLLLPGVVLEKISSGDGGFTTLTLKMADSDSLENFLNGVVEKGKSGKIKNIKVASTERKEDGHYNVSLDFIFLSQK